MSVANDYKFSSTNLICAGSLPQSIFVLHQRSEEVGRFRIVDGVMCFTGNTDTAARVMVDYFLEQFNEKIRAYGQQCREAALEDAARLVEKYFDVNEPWMNPHEIRALK